MKKCLLQTVVILGIALSIASSGKEREMNSSSPYVVQDFSNFDAESQTFQQGCDAEDFHISIPQSGKIERLFLADGKVEFEIGGLKGQRIQTSYRVQSTPNFKYLFYGSGVFLLKNNGERVFEFDWSQYRNFIEPVHQDGDTITFLMERLVAMMESNLELVAFSPNSRASKIVLSLPKEDENGALKITPNVAGIVVTRWRRSQSVAAKFYDFKGKEAFHPLAAAMNAMHIHGIDLSAGDPMFPEYGGLFPSKTKDNWAVFSQGGIPGYLTSRLFILSAIDSARAFPVKCEGHSLKPIQSLRFVVVHPHLNLFLAGAKLAGDVTMYLGHVRREGSLYKADTYRLQPFEQVSSPTFSRNGQVLLFAATEHGVEKVVMARLEDILSDINRRYPEAKLSLAALESEVK